METFQLADRHIIESCGLSSYPNTVSDESKMEVVKAFNNEVRMRLETVVLSAFASNVNQDPATNAFQLLRVIVLLIKQLSDRSCIACAPNTTV